MTCNGITLTKKINHLSSLNEPVLLYASEIWGQNARSFSRCLKITLRLSQTSERRGGEAFPGKSGSVDTVTIRT